MSSRGVLLYIEGDTEVRFFQAIVQYLQKQDPTAFKHKLVIYRNIKGIDNYQIKATRIFKNQILKDNPDVIFDVVLCYDTIVFEFSQKPHVNWASVEHSLKNAGANHVYHLKARQTIENWFLIDYPGILRFLNLPFNTQLPDGNGLEKLQALFMKVNRFYIKGSYLEGFIDQLDIETIAKNISNELMPLMHALDIK